MRWFVLIMLAMPLALGARTVRVGNVICNPGARVRVPVTVDDWTGVASVSAAAAYDPLILTLESARPGVVAEAAGMSFFTAEGAGRVGFAAMGAQNAEAGTVGTAATLTFLVREGSAGLYSDVAITEAYLRERTLTRDLSGEATARGGLLRVFAPDGVCETRQGEGPLTVAAGTTLRRLALAAGDALEADAAQTPIVVTDALSAAGELRILPPEGGWATTRYELLRCPTPGLTLTLDTADAPDACTLTEIASADGMTTYVLEATVRETIPVSAETPLSPADENLLRDLLADRLDGVREIRAEGTNEAILAGLDLGIVPATTSAGGTLTARFETPTLRVVAFDPQAGTARVRVIPAVGATIARPLATGVLQVRAVERLGAAMAPLEAGVDAAGYLDAATLGEAGLTFRLGRNLFIKVVAERPAAQTNANPDKEQQP